MEEPRNQTVRWFEPQNLLHLRNGYFLLLFIYLLLLFRKVQKRGFGVRWLLGLRLGDHAMSICQTSLLFYLLVKMVFVDSI